MKLFKRPSFACFKCKLKRTSFACFKPKLTFKQPCKKLFQCFNFKLRLKRRISIKALRFGRNRPRTTTRRNRIPGCLSLFRRRNRPHCTVRTTRRKNRISGLLSVFRRRRSSSTHHHQSSEEALDEVGELRSMTETGDRDRKLFPSPLTPAYVRNNGSHTREVAGGGRDGEIDEACRSFENHLVEMIVEEGKMRDLMDVEELLYCWKNLKCPVFIDLVSRFYGELCKDLFLLGDQQEEEEDSIHGFK
ncbi:hypothetical protein BVC80_1837g57 [Macleaya cordata]|uniref:OVATE domain-containing protein n=1 Tax=Macleaya cordata TaxID=56857 RepID=A0A200R3H0_MACCD|nr:hypothetical protein BVC80_1837g57 [Macleaya cordata]